MRIPIHGLLALLVAAAACSSTNGPDETRVVGAIAGYNADDPHVDAPATAERGVPFPVAVRTYGDGCYRASDTQVRVAGMAADVTPYDVTRRGVTCTQQLVSIAHTAVVQFEAAGAARVRVHGRGLRGEDLLVERLVQVR